jgi:pyruvate dehydrogenase E2 component (dihydrolipoamide acetyltransferase)
MSEFRMPSLGADMEAGTLVEWLKQPGDRVRRGDAIAAVETQKGAIEIEVYEDGILDRILVQLGERVPVGTALAIIRAEGEGRAEADFHRSAQAAESRQPMLRLESVTDEAQLVAAMSATPAPTAPPLESAAALAPKQAPAEAAVAISAVTPTRSWISPAARRRAQLLGLDLTSVPAAGDAVIGLREIDAAHAAAGATATADVVQPAAAGRTGLDRVEMRKAIAAAMTRSWREIPHYYVSSILDLEPLLSWLEYENAGRAVPVRLHYAAPLIKAVAKALSAVPSLNGHYGDGGLCTSAQVHLGIAIAMRGGGLIAPAILDADRHSPDQTMTLLNDLVARVRGGRLRSSELSASTATLTNLGEETADSVQPLIYPPQVAIIGCGQIIERAWVQERAISARRTMTVTVGGDHRVSDGRSASRFLIALTELLQHPERL